MCFKRCSCSGIVKNYKGNTYAEICPKCKLKNSFVTFPNLFRSLTVEKPKCLNIGNATYLTAGGTGLLNVQSGEVEGVYTLILADTDSKTDRFAFEFLSVNPSGYRVALFISFAADVSVGKCKWCKKKKKKTKHNQSHDKKHPSVSQLFGNYAKMVIFYPNGRVEEEDLISC